MAVRILLALVLLAAVALPSSASADDDGLHAASQLGDLTLEYWLAPAVYRQSALELHLADATGQPPTDVRRVDVQFAMAGMNHGARGVEVEMVEPGIYQAAGYLLAMPGPWWMAVRVERADGRLLQARYGFVTPLEAATNTAFALDARPDGPAQVYDVAISPGETIPGQIAVTAGRPVRLEVIYTDNPGCGPSVQVADPPARADLTSDGLGELTFTPTATGQLNLTCAPAGLLVGP